MSSVCDFCKIQRGIYFCPKCERRYCCLNCYKSNMHQMCTEIFYKEWVKNSLQNQAFDEGEKKNMEHIIKCQNELTTDVSNSSLADRFESICIAEADEHTLWENLNKNEKEEFTALLKDESKLENIIILRKPWWERAALKLVSDMEEDENIEDVIDCVSARPHFPLNIKMLSDITCRRPSECIKFNIVNILYAYAFLSRFYNCELRDFVDEVMHALFVYSPVLSDGKNYLNLEESIQDSTRLVTSSDICVSLELAKNVLNDVCKILQGPINAKPYTFVLCALHDFKQLLLEARCSERKKKEDKSFRKKLMPTVKKLDYFMSWSIDFESNFTKLASDIQLFSRCKNILGQVKNTVPLGDLIN